MDSGTVKSVGYNTKAELLYSPNVRNFIVYHHTKRHFASSHIFKTVTQRKSVACTSHSSSLLHKKS